MNTNELGWECFNCGNTVALEVAQEAEAKLREKYGDKLSLRDKPQCPECKSENVRKYY